MSIQNNSESVNSPIFYWRGAFDPNLLAIDERVQQAVSNLLNNTHNPNDLEKLKNHRIYSLRLNHADRLLFSDVNVDGKNHMVLLDVVLNHDYQKSRFLKSGVLQKFYIKHQDALEEPIDIENLVFENVSNEETKHLSALVKGGTSWRPMEYYQSKFIKLNDHQGRVIETQLPAVVIGAPGSGKSCVALSCLVEFLKSNNLEGKKLLYVCSSQNLAEAMKRIWEELPIAVECKAEVTFTSYEKLIEKEFSHLNDRKQPSQAEVSQWFKTKLPNIKKTPQFKGKEIGINKDHEKSVFEEFLVVSTCTKEAYMALGGRQSIYSEEDEKELVWALYESYQRWLEDQKKVDLRFQISECETRYDLSVVDEAADLSPLELLQLYKMSHDGQVAYFMDSNQDLRDQFAKEILLKNMMRQYEILCGTLNLPTVYRCPKQVVELANRVLGIKAALFGGTLGKETYREIEIQQQNVIGDGKVSCCHGDFKEHYDHFRETYKETEIAIIVEESKKSELTALGIKKSMLFTPEEIKGLEFKCVMLYEPLGKVVFKEVNKALNEVEKAELNQNIHRSKDTIDYTSNTEIIPALNKLFTSITRSQETLLVFQKVAHQVKKIHELLIDEKWLQKGAKMLAGKAIETGLSDWIQQAKMYYENGNMAKFEEVCQDLGRKSVDVLSELFPSHEGVSSVGSDSPSSSSSGSTSDSPQTIRIAKKKKKKKKKKQSPLREAIPQDSQPIASTSSSPHEPEKVSAPLVSRRQKELNRKEMNIIENFLQEVRKGVSEAKVKEFMQRKNREHLLFWMKDENGDSLFDRIQRLPHGEEVVYQIREQVDDEEAACRGEAYLYCLYYGKADVHDLDRQGNSHLHFAAEHGHFDLVKNLVKAGADVNCEADDGFTPLHNAAMYNHIEITRYLVKMGARVNARTKEEKYTPLMFAAGKGSFELVQFLVEKDALVKVKNVKGESPIYFAANRGSLEIVEYFIEKKALEQKREIVKKGKKFVVEDKKAEVISPLFPAVRKGHEAIVDCLIKAGVSVDVVDTATGMTPLHIAAKDGRVAIYDKLIKAGAKIKVKDNNGKTSKDLVQPNFQDEILTARGSGESSTSCSKIPTSQQKKRRR